MVGTQPPPNSNKWWHLGKEKKRYRRKANVFFFKIVVLILDKNQKRNGKKKPHLTRLVRHVAQKIKHTHSHKWVLCFKCAIQSTYLHVFPFTPPLFSPVTPYPLLLCWQTALISSELGDRYVISWGETGLSSAGEYEAASSSEQTDTHDTFRHSLPDSTLACRQNQRGHLSHAIRLENKDDEVRCTKESWGSEGCNERWLEVEAPANELQRAGETNSSWLGSLLKPLLDIIKADNDRQPLADRHDSKLC